MRHLIGHMLIAIIVGIIIFLMIRFVGQRNEFWYIGPDTNSEWYRYLVDWLHSWWSYLSWDLTGLSQTQQYFSRAIDKNRDTILGQTLTNNMNKVQERSQLETIQQCVAAVRDITHTRETIDTSYNQTLTLLQDQINLIPTVLWSVKDLSTLSCVKNYFDQIKSTSMLLVQTSQSRWSKKQEYTDEINQYPKQLGNCDKILLIQKQSKEFQQQLQQMQYTYTQYRDILWDPARYRQLCNQRTNTTSPQPKLQQLPNNVNTAISTIKSKMTQ